MDFVKRIITKDVVSEADRKLIEKHLKRKGATKCPPSTFSQDASMAGSETWIELKARNVRINARLAKFERARAKQEKNR